MAWLRWLKRRFSSETEEGKQPNRAERRIAVATDLIERVIVPWKKALETRGRIIESLKNQRVNYRTRLGEYVKALEKRDGIIRDLRQKQDDLEAKLEAIEKAEKPEGVDAVGEDVLPASPGAAPGEEGVADA